MDSSTQPSQAVDTSAASIDGDTIAPQNVTSPRQACSTSGVTIAFKDLSYSVEVPVESSSYMTFISPLVSAAKTVVTLGKSNAKKTFYRLQNVSGIVRPGTMKLVIAPPGHGKSTYLKMLGYRLPLQSGDLRYNGRTLEQAADEGCDLKKMTQYVDQVDTHLPLLTVTETLDFAHKVSSHKYDPERVASTISLLGLDECKDTILGNELIRGVSGGQKRRVTLGEMLVSDASTLLLDEFTNGLDTATSEDIARGLRSWCLDTNGSIVSTLQQPTPGLYNTFDDIVILREGQVVFDGPREDVLPFFEAMGFRCPGDVDVCDFLIDVLSQPRLSLQRQRDADKKDAKAGKVAPAAAPLQTSSGAALAPAAKPCVSTDDMVAFFKASPLAQDIDKALQSHFPAKGASGLPEGLPALMPDEHARALYGVGDIMPWTTLLKMVFQRQLQTIYRDTQNLLGPRIMNILLTSLMVSSLYYGIGHDSFILRSALLLFLVGQVAFGNMVELPIFIAAIRVATKQINAGFYRSQYYICSAAVAMMPILIFEVFVFTTFLYWMADNYPGAEQFFVCLAIGVVSAFCLSIFFRFLSLLGDKAEAFASPSVGIMMLLSGFFVSRSAMPEWSAWLIWLSPFSWSVRALLNNEFGSPRYDAINAQNVRVGDAYIDTLDFEVGSEWIGYAVLFMLVVAVLLMAAHSVLIRNPYHELSIGTRRTDDEELLDSEMDLEGEPQLTTLVPADNDADADAADGEGALERQESAASLSRDASSFNQNTLQTLREALPFHPTWLSFSDVKYTVQIQVDGQTKDKVLLDGVSGYAEPGKLTALMGASGAGKTTLLDVLAGRKTTGSIEGTILLNGRAPTADDLASITGYVEQFDSLLPYDTVRETLRFAARLRLPASVSEEVKEKIVDEVLEILDLAPIQGYLIGNETIPGLSPSQLKRVNIGVELVANPSVLFLDEPTTGLDSKAAQTVMRVVRRIARSGRSVVCTIHQPSGELFYLFDRLVLLGSGGHQIYFGDLGHRSTRFIKYLQSVPGVKPIPARYNPASWMLEELGVGVAAVKAADNEDNASTESQAEMIQRFKAFYFKSRVYRRAAARLKALETLSGEEESIEYSVSRAGLEDRQASYSVSVAAAALPTDASTIQQKDAPSLWYQYKLVQARSFISYWRNPPFMFARMVVLLILSLLFSILYFDLNVTEQSQVMSAISSRAVSCLFAGVIIGGTSLPVMMRTRAVFIRERSSSMYNAGLWSATATVTELFWMIWCAFIFQIPIYFMVGMKSTVAAFFQFYLALYTTMAAFLAMTQLISAVAPDIVFSQVISGFYYGLFFTFSGVTIQAPSVPAGWVWFFNMLPISHLTDFIISTQLDEENTLIAVQAGTQIIDVPVSTYVAQFMGLSYEGNWNSFGWAMLFIVVVQVLAFFATKKLVTAKR